MTMTLQLVRGTLNVWIWPNVTTLHLNWGQPLRIECYASGTPPPSPVQWGYVDQYLVDHNEDDSTSSLYPDGHAVVNS